MKVTTVKICAYPTSSGMKYPAIGNSCVLSLSHRFSEIDRRKDSGMLSLDIALNEQTSSSGTGQSESILSRFYSKYFAFTANSQGRDDTVPAAKGNSEPLSIEQSRDSFKHLNPIFRNDTTRASTVEL